MRLSMPCRVFVNTVAKACSRIVSTKFSGSFLHDATKTANPDRRLLFQECVEIASSLPGGEGHLALAYFRIYQIPSELLVPTKADDHLEKAKTARAAFLGNVKEHPSLEWSNREEQAYTSLVPFLLW